MLRHGPCMSRLACGALTIGIHSGGQSLRDTMWTAAVTQTLNIVAALYSIWATFCTQATIILMMLILQPIMLGVATSQ